MKELYSFNIEREVEVKAPAVSKINGVLTESTQKVKKKIPYRIVVRKPTKHEIEDAEFFYSQKFNEFINFGFLTRAMLNKKMSNNGGIATKELTDAIQGLLTANADAQRIVEFYGAAKDLTDEQAAKLTEAKGTLALTQKQIFDYETAFNQQYNHTADIKAEQKLYEFFIFNFSFYEEELNGEKAMFPIFQGESYEDKRDFYLAISEDVEDIEDQELLKHKAIFDASFDRLIKVINIWYRNLGKTQKDIDAIIKAIEDAELPKEETPVEEAKRDQAEEPIEQKSENE